MSSYRNLDAREGTINGAVTLTLNLRPRRIIITNDSASADLSFKFNATEEYATLKPTETITLDIAHKEVRLSGMNVPYRVWGMG